MGAPGSKVAGKRNNVGVGKCPDLTLIPLRADKEARHQRLGMRQQASLGYRGDQWLRTKRSVPG